MDSIETTSHDMSMEATATNEDVLILLQTESGEQIALPMSALPSDFVPGDSGQIIMVESVDEQQQEVVVESSSTTESQSNNDTLVEIQVDTSSILSSTAITTNDSSKNSNDAPTQQNDIPMIQIQTTNSGDKPVPRTYSKSNVFKSYAPTCGATRIYQQSQLISSNSLGQNNSGNIEIHNNDSGSLQKEKIVSITSSGETTVQNELITLSSPKLDQLQSAKLPAVTVTTSNQEVPPKPHKKQKRKETLLTRPLNEEDMKLEFQITEDPLPEVQEVEVKRKPRKEYRTKKKMRMERLSKEELADDLELCDTPTRVKKQETSKKEEIKEEKSDDKEPDFLVETKVESTKETKKEICRRELPKRGSNKDKPIETKPAKPEQPQTERRTRLSNTCRVATGKSYKCNDCDFSTDRINNIILHVRENCPKLKKT